LQSAKGRLGAFAIGWAGSRAVFGVFHRRFGYVAYNTETEDWERIPTPEGNPDVCATSDALLTTAIAHTTSRADVTFEYRDGAWTRVAREPQLAPNQEGSYTTCATNVVIYVPFLKVGGFAPMWMFSSDRKGWQPLPALDIPHGTSPSIEGSAFGDTQLLALEDHSQVRVFSRSAESPGWTEHDAPASAWTRVFALDEKTFLLVPSDPMKDGLFIGTV
jgi:hypothetical protein